MRLKEGFVLQDVAGQTVVIPTGDTLDLNMMISLNETGKFLWNRLAKGAEPCELIAALLEEYQVEEATAEAHVTAFLQKLQAHGFLE